MEEYQKLLRKVPVVNKLNPELMRCLAVVRRSGMFTLRATHPVAALNVLVLLCGQGIEHALDVFWESVRPSGSKHFMQARKLLRK